MKILPHALLDELAAQAAASPRARAHHTIHASAADPVQRFIVSALRDAYFRPHRHNTRSELAVVLRGRFDVLTFDAQGRVSARYSVGERAAALAYETPQGTWHTLVPGDRRRQLSRDQAGALRPGHGGRIRRLGAGGRGRGRTDFPRMVARGTARRERPARLNTGSRVLVSSPRGARPADADPGRGRHRS